MEEIQKSTRSILQSVLPAVKVASLYSTSSSELRLWWLTHLDVVWEADKGKPQTVCGVFLITQDNIWTAYGFTSKQRSLAGGWGGVGGVFCHHNRLKYRICFLFKGFLEVSKDVNGWMLSGCRDLVLNKADDHRWLVLSRQYLHRLYLFLVWPSQGEGSPVLLVSLRFLPFLGSFSSPWLRV